MEEFNYELECGMCSVYSVLLVIEEQEIPTYCPMCGSDQSSEWNGPLYN